MNWTRRFDDPVPMPDGSTIRTIGEAAKYATSLPRTTGNTEPWQRAARVLARCRRSTEARSSLWRIVFYKAVHGETRPPIGNPEGKKGYYWGKRKRGKGSGKLHGGFCMRVKKDTFRVPLTRIRKLSR